MTGRIVFKQKLVGAEFVSVPQYYLDGQLVTEKKYRKAFPQREGFGTTMDGRSTYPHTSMAVGVHPRQAKAAAAHAAKIGVPTDFTADGKAIMRNRGHRRDYLRAMGAHDNNAYGRV